MNPNKPNKLPPIPKPMFHGWKYEEIIKFYENMLKSLPNIDNKEEIEKQIQNEMQQIKTGVVNIYKMLELRKLHIIKQNACSMGGNCKSFCQDLGCYVLFSN